MKKPFLVDTCTRHTLDRKYTLLESCRWGFPILVCSTCGQLFLESIVVGSSIIDDANEEEV